MSEAKTKIVTIDLDNHAYDIYIGQGLLSRAAELIPDDIMGRSVFIITDKNVEPYAKQVETIMQDNRARHVHMMTLKPGEGTKSFDNVQRVSEWMLENNLNRNSYVFAIGGGVIGDLGGFCASIVMRGVPYVQIPTSLLAQVDSSVGGKTGINTPQGKNLIGSFYQPVSVLADIDVLKTLSPRELLAGYAEVVKYGLINDMPFFEWLEANGARMANLDADALAYAIENCTKSKAAIVEADEKENGVRALLNLGHTFGHALETAAKYNGTLLHGEGVSIGIILAYELSAAMGLFPQEHIERVENHFMNMGLPTRVDQIPNFKTDIESLMTTMRRDKKARSGKMVFILANAIGDTFVSKDVEENAVRDVLKKALGGQSIDTSKLNKEGMKERWKSAFSSQA
ncbi:MAG: 3-dehydroquinate synthase [Alphaproteobacteria bacterium]|nr:3-dehydroquinate synthase [Alphaproteobacteria bacterium]